VDIGLFFTDEGIIDIRLTNGDFDPGRDLETAVLISIFTNRRARDDDRLPDNSGELGGWWGDTFADIEGDEIGSRLWLLSRETRTGETLERAREYLRECLEWITEDGITERVVVDVEYDTRRLDTMLFTIDIFRPDGKSTFKYDYVWAQFDLPGKDTAAELAAIKDIKRLLLETGDVLLNEDGSGILLEDSL
jgi:phage gp46-like protein